MTTARGTTVLLAGSDAGLRDDVREQLEQRGFEVVATAADALGAVCAALEHGPQLCVFDAALVGGVLEAAEHVERQVPDVRVVLLADPGEADGRPAVDTPGLRGSVPRGTAGDVLADELRRVLAGRP